MEQVRQLHDSLRRQELLEQRTFANNFWRNRDRLSVAQMLSGAQKDMRKAHGGILEFRAALSKAYSDLFISKEEMDAAVSKYLKEYEAASVFKHSTCILENGACVGHVFSN